MLLDVLLVSHWLDGVELKAVWLSLASMPCSLLCHVRIASYVCDTALGELPLRDVNLKPVMR